MCSTQTISPVLYVCELYQTLYSQVWRVKYTIHMYVYTYVPVDNICNISVQYILYIHMYMFDFIRLIQSTILRFKVAIGILRREHLLTG